ncbi:iron ABC transporter ATP-binding protein FetA [Enterobacterales bacterium CwR94]|nr:iron ABC transporter ATP-binding protein FetA [Enterobacterales bacterium CwR94]
MSKSPPLLDVQHVSFSQDAKTYLAPTSLQLSAGEIVILTGPSGSGKSTLLKVIAELLTPTGGQILLEGQPQASMQPERWRQEVSYCFQTPQLFGETVWDNLAFPWLIRHQTPERAVLATWMNRVHLTAEQLDSPIDALSGGEKQRVALLRNLQFMPKVLLLDEITSALDEENKTNIRQLIAGLAEKQGVAVLWVSHDRTEIDQAQRVVTLQQGAHHE